jgi:hypothetical protein
MAKWRRPTEEERCTARSKQRGDRCDRYSSAGQKVCYYHGGASPQAKAKAEERLAIMADRAMEVLADVMDDPESSDRDKVRAAVATLDRAGYGAQRRVELTTTALEAELERLNREIALEEARG